MFNQSGQTVGTQTNLSPLTEVHLVWANWTQQHEELIAVYSDKQKALNRTLTEQAKIETRKVQKLATIFEVQTVQISKE